MFGAEKLIWAKQFPTSLAGMILSLILVFKANLTILWLFAHLIFQVVQVQDVYKWFLTTPPKKLISAKKEQIRITSYNVCYTKLLRALEDLGYLPIRADIEVGTVIVKSYNFV